MEQDLSIFGGSFFVFMLVAFIILVIPYWMIFKKAGREGWEGIIPIYNVFILLKIINKPAWWIILFFIPIVNFIFLIIVTHRLSMSFGKGALFTVGLVLLTPIFLYILAFDGSTYERLED